MRVAGRTVTVVRVRVHPTRPLAGDSTTLVFDGEAYLDLDRAAIIRLRGRFGAFNLRPARGDRIVAAALGGLRAEYYVDLENAEHEGRWWLPLAQRIELQATTAAIDGRASVRYSTRFRDLRPIVADEARDSLRTRPLARLTFAPGDSLRRFDDWRRGIGIATREGRAADFDDVAPAALRSTGPAQWRWRARRPAELLRVNRVEGLFTGVSGQLRGRDDFPGLLLRLTAGWAWQERTARGGVEGALVRGPWGWAARGERALVSTNDFTPAFAGAGWVTAAFGEEGTDWVDRRTATLGLTRALGRGRTSAVRLEVGWGADDATPASLARAPLTRASLSPNRPVDAGDYRIGTVAWDMGRDVTGETLQPGLGLFAQYQHAEGALPWRRVDARLAARRLSGPLVLAARIDGGMLLGAGRPTQRLLEVGGEEGLPGYGYKQFAGDRAVVGRLLAMWPLPLLRTPIRLGRGPWTIPAPAPAPSVGLQAGWTDASPAGAAVLARHGWATTGRPRRTLDLRLRFFGGAVSLGAAKPLETGGRWRFVAGLGGQL